MFRKIRRQESRAKLAACRYGAFQTERTPSDATFLGSFYFSATTLLKNRNPKELLATVP